MEPAASLRPSGTLAHKYHILSTALLPEKAVTLLTENNIGCDQIAFIRTETALTETLIQTIQQLAKEQHHVLFTSTQAIAAVTRCLDGYVPDWTLYCISGATKIAASEYFGTEKIGAYADDAISLAPKIIADDVKHVLFFCGNKRLDTLPALLAEKQVAITEYQVYETKLTPVRLEMDYDALLFFSPSGVESYLQENTIPERSLLFAIGRTTAKALSVRVGNAIQVAGAPDKNILVQTVIDHFKKQP